MSIESEEFYNLCQAYRFAPMADQKQVLDSYQALIDYIDNYSEGYAVSYEMADNEN